MHRRYVDAGCDVSSRRTPGGCRRAVRAGRHELVQGSRPVHWMDVARQGVRLARAAAEEGGRARGVRGRLQHQRRRRHARRAGDDPAARAGVRGRPARPDPDGDAVARARLDLRDGRAPAGDRACPCGSASGAAATACAGSTGSIGAGRRAMPSAAPSAASRRLGVGALLINCIPPDHVPGMISWLRDFTDLPLGVYPNLGYLSAGGWRSETAIGGAEYAELALEWREEGAQIIGGCCGVGPEHMAAARAALADTKPGHARGSTCRRSTTRTTGAAAAACAEPWTDARGRALFPLDFPDIHRRPGRVRPHPGELPGVEVPLPRGHRRPPALPRHRLRHGPADGPAGAQRRRSRARDRHRRNGGVQHDDQRLSQRRGRSRQRRGGRSLPVGARGALRRDRREPLPDAGRSVRAGVHAPAARLLGPQPDRPPDRAAARGAGRRRRRLRACSCRSSGSSARPSSSTRSATARGSSTSPSSSSTRSSRRSPSRSHASRSSPTPTTWSSATAT